jgi:hypothetical protein
MILGIVQTRTDCEEALPGGHPALPTLRCVPPRGGADPVVTTDFHSTAQRLVTVRQLGLSR